MTRKIHLALFLCLCLLPVAACANPPGPSPSIPEREEAAASQSPPATPNSKTAQYPLQEADLTFMGVALTLPCKLSDLPVPVEADSLAYLSEAFRPGEYRHAILDTGRTPDGKPGEESFIVVILSNDSEEQKNAED